MQTGAQIGSSVNAQYIIYREWKVMVYVSVTYTHTAYYIVSVYW